jgi:hypothetical protein
MACEDAPIPFFPGVPKHIHEASTETTLLRDRLSFNNGVPPGRGGLEGISMQGRVVDVVLMEEGPDGGSKRAVLAHMSDRFGDK